MITRPDECFRTAVTAAQGIGPALIEPGRLHRFRTNGKRGHTSGWCKLFDGLRATLALRDFVLNEVSDGDGGTMFLVQRWGQSRKFGSLTDVRAFALQVGAIPKGGQ